MVEQAEFMVGLWENLHKAWGALVPLTVKGFRKAEFMGEHDKFRCIGRRA